MSRTRAGPRLLAFVRPASRPRSFHLDALLVSTFAVAVAEIGDKTQLLALVLAARYSPLWQVITGTTLGMAIANVPVVVLGSRFAAKLPLKAARYAAEAIFAGLALWVAVGGLPG